MSELNFKYHPEVYRLYNDIYNKNSFKGLINKLVYWDKRLPKNFDNTLTKLRTQVQEIYNALTPLFELGITFDMWVVGGSIRDLLLNNESKIKDLDIVISFNHQKRIKLPTAEYFFKNTKFDLSLPNLEKIIYRDDPEKPLKVWSECDYYTKNKKQISVNEINKRLFLFDLVAIALGQQFDCYESYPPNVSTLEKINPGMSGEATYLDSKLSGVLKIRKDNWDWPVDILMSMDSIHSILDAFDFGICKVALQVVKKTELMEQSFIYPESNKDFLKRVMFTQHFLNDVKNKKLTFELSPGLSLKQLARSLDEHYYRLEKKYDWDVEPLYYKYGMDKENPLVKYVQSFLLKRNMEKSLSTKKVIKKVKI